MILKKYIYINQIKKRIQVSFLYNINYFNKNLKNSIDQSKKRNILNIYFIRKSFNKFHIMSLSGILIKKREIKFNVIIQLLNIRKYNNILFSNIKLNSSNIYDIKI